MGRELPIPFKGEMIRQIIAGTKTATRRLPRWSKRQTLHLQTNAVRSYEVGDQLWVRETFKELCCPKHDEVLHHGECTCENRALSIVYHADGANVARCWTPSIFMRRWMSRIDLLVVDVRWEHLQEITEAEILREGITVPIVAEMTGVAWSEIPTLHDAWKLGWNHINGHRPGAKWEDNPLVRRFGFKLIRVRAAA